MTERIRTAVCAPGADPVYESCPNCWRGITVACAVGCRDMDECCDKPLGVPCHCASGVARAEARDA